MMNLFHVAPIPLGVGSVIEPGNWGRLMRFNDQQSFVVRRERIFEEVRAAHYPGKPSRMNCIFCLVFSSDAAAYRDEFGPRNIIYEVEATRESAPVHIAPIALVPSEEVSGLVQAAHNYWSFSLVDHAKASGTDQQPHLVSNVVTKTMAASVPETLLGCSVRVVSRFDELER
ncbi:DUF2441 domain-containing protein [Comamonas aquatica]|uniref:DUF2441 domain-containing protein n=1 Tax=Comamonas aquatica TaxID=225991 RepID=UPI00244BEF21|nr:DUF2441 domain-containing protein [Comamonas aquatica]MDH0899656.1 DUF2441 domain-containing protein [Comamonas aquatica]